MPPEKQLSAIIRQLVQRTQEGEINWSDTANEDAFRTALHTALIRVERFLDSRAGEETLHFSLVIMDPKRNREVEFYSPSPVSDDWHALGELWNLARRSARNTEQVLGSVLEELASPRTRSEPPDQLAS